MTSVGGGHSFSYKSHLPNVPPRVSVHTSSFLDLVVANKILFLFFFQLPAKPTCHIVQRAEKTARKMAILLNISTQVKAIFYEYG